MVAGVHEVKKYTGLLICHIDGHEFGFDMKDLVKITDLSDVNELLKPKSIFVFGGVIFQILNLNEIFKLELKPESLSKLVLLEIKEKTIGLLVDKVIEIIATNKRSYELLVFREGNNDYMKEIIEFEGRKIVVPNLVKIIKEQLS